MLFLYRTELEIVEGLMLLLMVGVLIGGLLGR